MVLVCWSDDGREKRNGNEHVVGYDIGAEVGELRLNGMARERQVFGLVGGK
jgi:hypothetical protein